MAWLYHFGAGKADGRADMKNLLGGKGANLAETRQCLRIFALRAIGMIEKLKPCRRKLFPQLT